jgi:hypothetical protein
MIHRIKLKKKSKRREKIVHGNIRRGKNNLHNIKTFKHSEPYSQNRRRGRA